MQENLEKVKRIFIQKIDTVSKIEKRLSEELKRNRDNSWGVSVINEVGVHFNRLRDLDREHNEIEWIRIVGSDTETLKLANKLQTSMRDVKKLMSIFRMKIKGGQEIVKGELRKIVKAKKVNRYKSMYV